MNTTATAETIDSEFLEWWAVLGHERPGPPLICPAPGCTARPDDGALHCPDHDHLLGISLQVHRFSARWWLLMFTRAAAVSVFPYSARLRSPIPLRLLGAGLVIAVLWLLGRRFRSSLRTSIAMFAVVSLVAALTMFADAHRRSSRWIATGRTWEPCIVLLVAVLICWYVATRTLRSRALGEPAARAVATSAVGGLAAVLLGEVLSNAAPRGQRAAPWQVNSLKGAGWLSLVVTLVVAAVYAFWREWSHINTAVQPLLKLPEYKPRTSRADGLRDRQHANHLVGVRALAFQTTIEMVRIAEWIERVLVLTTRSVLSFAIAVANRLHTAVVRFGRRVATACVFVVKAVVEGARAVLHVALHVTWRVILPALLFAGGAWCIERSSHAILSYLLNGPLSSAVSGLCLAAVVCVTPALAFVLTSGESWGAASKAGASAAEHFLPRLLVLFTCGAWVVGIGHAWKLSPIKIGPIAIVTSIVLVAFTGYVLLSNRDTDSLAKPTLGRAVGSRNFRSSRAVVSAPTRIDPTKSRTAQGPMTSWPAPRLESPDIIKPLPRPGDLTSNPADRPARST
jgi:hypothetical protein